MKEFIEIPFGAKDSELGGWEYTIPEGYIASIENGKIIVKKEESEDDVMRKMAIKAVHAPEAQSCIKSWGANPEDVIAWLEKQDTKVSVYRDTLFKIATVLSQYEDKDDSPLEKIRSIMIDGTICSMDLESKNKKQGEQKPTDEEMKILLQTEYEKGKADAIEQKSAWSEWDEKIYNLLYERYKDLAYYSHSRNKAEDIPGEILGWLKSLKDRVYPKQEWGEDDKGNLLNVKCIIDEVWHNQAIIDEIDYSCEELESLWHWLDNIWQRVEYPQSTWKPSDEQMYALRTVVTELKHSDNKYQEIIEDLYNDLEKLKG